MANTFPIEAMACEHILQAVLEYKPRGILLGNSVFIIVNES